VGVCVYMQGRGCVYFQGTWSRVYTGGCVCGCWQGSLSVVYAGGASVWGIVRGWRYVGVCVRYSGEYMYVGVCVGHTQGVYVCGSVCWAY